MQKIKQNYLHVINYHVKINSICGQSGDQNGLPNYSSIHFLEYCNASDHTHLFHITHNHSHEDCCEVYIQYIYTQHYQVFDPHVVTATLKNLVCCFQFSCSQPLPCFLVYVFWIFDTDLVSQFGYVCFAINNNLYLHPPPDFT